MSTQKKKPGRPTATEAPAPSEDQMLRAALDEFAENGFAGTSVRKLARDLGVSHNLIPQRFGSKERLWYAAVDHGFGALANELFADLEALPTEDVARLRAMVVRFVSLNAKRPALLQIISQEATTPGELHDYVTRMRPKLAVNEQTVQFIEFLTSSGKRPGEVAPAAEQLFRRLSLRGSMGLFPAWARELVGMRHDAWAQRTFYDPFMRSQSKQVRWATDKPAYAQLAEARVRGVNTESAAALSALP